LQNEQNLLEKKTKTSHCSEKKTHTFNSFTSGKKESSKKGEDVLEQNTIENKGMTSLTVE
jgi:hypothetical protein